MKLKRDTISQLFFKCKIKEKIFELKTKVLDDKALRFSVSSCQQQILYLYVILSCKPSYKKRLFSNLKVSYVYCKSFIIITVYFWLAKYIVMMLMIYVPENTWINCSDYANGLKMPRYNYLWQHYYYSNYCYYFRILVFLIYTPGWSATILSGF